MKTARLKNIVIVVLALANAFLLILLVSRKGQERAAQERTVSRLVQLYASNGVELPPSLVPLDEPRLSPCEPARSLEDEAAFAEVLLSSCTQEDVGGGIYRYVSGAGQCLFRSSGAVEASMNRHVKDPAAFCEGLFAAYGYEMISSDLTDGTGTVTAVRVLQGSTVFNAELSLTFAQSWLTSATGSFVPALEPSVHGGGIDGVTALVRFLDYCNGSGEVCTLVREMRSGYLLQSTTSVSQRLIPAWSVTTDVSNYYVNSITGEVMRET